MKTYADVARISPLNLQEMEQWIASRDISIAEAFRIWQDSIDEESACNIFENEDYWTDENAQ